MSPAVKNGLMLVVLVGALALAGFFFNRSNKESVYPDDKSMATQWICAKCQKHYELTPAQYKEWIDSKDKVRRDPNYPGRLVVFWCNDCSAFTVVRATIDRKTMTWSPSFDPSTGEQSAGAAGKPSAKGAKPPSK